MKRLLYIILLILPLMMCDIIDPPFFNEDTYQDATCVMSDFPPLPDKIEKKFLLEEFTGARCLNCPEGHKEALRLSGIYGKQLVTIAIHAGEEAVPTKDMPYDFRTTVGTELNAKLNPNNQFPMGTVCRTKNNEGAVSYFYDEWQTMIARQSLETPAAIQIINNYDNGIKKLCTHLKVSVIDNHPHPLRLSVFLTEDSIVKPQVVGTNGIVENYVHRHVLRHGFNSTFGVRLLKGETHKGAFELKRYSVVFAEKDWKVEKCAIVAVLTDETTGEIVQAEHQKIIN